MPVQHGVLAHLRSDLVRTKDSNRRKGRNAALRSRAIGCASNSLRNKGKSNVISRAFRIRHQDGGCRRIQSLHVYSRHGDPGLYGRRDPRVGCCVCGHGHCPDRLSDHRRHSVSGRLLHAVFARVRSVDRGFCPDAACVDRQAAGRDDRRCPAQLGPRFIGNFLGALTVAVMMSIVYTYGFSIPPDKVGAVLAGIGEALTLGYAKYGAAGMLTLFIRGMLCNWMVSTGVVGAMISTTVPGKVIAMWMPIMVFFAMVFEHSVVNMFLFPSALIMGGHFSILDYFIWNEIPTVVGNLVGGLSFTGLTLYATHVRTAPKRELRAAPARAAA